jgi:hypothetical protein
VLVPYAFGPSHNVFTPADPEADPVEFDDPGRAKHAPPNGKPELTCDYSLQWAGPDGTYASVGTVWGFLANAD